MINLCNRLPMIELGGQSVAVEAAWLEQSLEQAAMAAGYVAWLPAEHVARTVTVCLLEDSRTGTPLPWDRFALAVRGVLTSIGYGEVAPHFLSGGVELGFSLLEVAEVVPAGFELGFFSECDRAMKQVLSSGLIRNIVFEDAVPAVKRLLNRSRWCGQCEAMREELVDFIRSRLALRGPSTPLFFSIH